MYSMREMWFWNIEACKSILVDPKNKIMNIGDEHKRSSLTFLLLLYLYKYIGTLV